MNWFQGDHFTCGGVEYIYQGFVPKDGHFASMVNGNSEIQFIFRTTKDFVKITK